MFGTKGEGRTCKSSCTPNQKFCFVLGKRRYHFERAVTKCLSGTIWSCALYSPYRRQWHCLFLVTTTGMYTWLCIRILMVFLGNKLWGKQIVTFTDRYSMKHVFFLFLNITYKLNAMQSLLSIVSIYQILVHFTIFSPEIKLWYALSLKIYTITQIH